MLMRLMSFLVSCVVEEEWTATASAAQISKRSVYDARVL